jgi:hypothetical protein
VPSEKWSCARRSSRDARDEGPLADDVIRNGLAWLQRNPSVTPAWVQRGSLVAIWGQFSANSAVMHRSRNRLASEPPRGSWREGSCPGGDPGHCDFGRCRGPQPPISKMLTFDVDLI